MKHIINMVSPSVTIADCGDIWPKKTMQIVGRECTNVFCTTDAIFELNRSLGNTNIKLVSSGYFTSSQLDALSK